MGSSYTEELLTDSGLKECQCTEATSTQQWNVATVYSVAKCDGELCLNPISSVSSHFNIRRSLKDQWSRYRLPHSISPASHPSAPSFRSFFTICILSFLAFHLPSHFCTVAYSSRCLYLSDLACTTHRIVEGEKGTFISPVLPFPKIPEGH